MQDDNKKPTVEDQELADMIASMNGAQPKAGASPTPATPPPPPLGAPAPIGPLSASSPMPPQSAPTTLSVPKSPVPPVPAAPPLAQPPNPLAPQPTPVSAPLPPKPQPTQPTPTPATVPTLPAGPPSNLGAIKKNALDELRPLVDRLDLPPDEKFDTLLLLIRSTDDKTLIKSAYTAASQIKDDTKRAEALLDIVKEIDFFENPVN